MSIHVILEDMPDFANWQAAIIAAGFKLTLDPTLDTQRSSGFVNANFDEVDTGFEFDVGSLPDNVPHYLAHPQPDDPRRQSANFRWGGDLLEMCCAFAAASALAKLTGGVLFQAEDGSTYSGDEAVTAARSEIAAADGMY